MCIYFCSNTLRKTTYKNENHQLKKHIIFSLSLWLREGAVNLGFIFIDLSCLFTCCYKESLYPWNIQSIPYKLAGMSHLICKRDWQLLLLKLWFDSRSRVGDIEGLTLKLWHVPLKQLGDVEPRGYRGVGGSGSSVGVIEVVTPTPPSTLPPFLQMPYDDRGPRHRPHQDTWHWCELSVLPETGACQATAAGLRVSVHNNPLDQKTSPPSPQTPP